jgi:hypothetical protein
MAAAPSALVRCSEPGCPWRWRHGEPRPCPDHADEGDLVAAARKSLGLEDAPGFETPDAQDGARDSAGW